MPVSKDIKKMVAAVFLICVFAFVMVVWESVADAAPEDSIVAELEEQLYIQKDESSKMALHIEMLEMELEKVKAELEEAKK